MVHKVTDAVAGVAPAAVQEHIKSAAGTIEGAVSGAAAPAVAKAAEQVVQQAKSAQQGCCSVQ